MPSFVILMNFLNILTSDTHKKLSWIQAQILLISSELTYEENCLLTIIKSDKTQNTFMTRNRSKRTAIFNKCCAVWKLDI